METEKYKTDLMNLLRASIEHSASDLHLSPGQPPIMRINGNLTRITEFPVNDSDTIRDLVSSVLDETQIHVFDKKLVLDFSVILPNLGAFRANFFHQQNGVSAVFRVIPIEIPDIESLGTPPIVKEILELSSGLILVTGPTGCGKSTTLASMIEYINANEDSHIITIEDPIEFIHHNKRSLVHQRQVIRDTSSFSDALRAALREDPDVILVGEMRDLETIRLALTAAETGHLVLATLHTSSAPRAISRVVDVFPSGEKNIIRNLISESLQCVITQTLVKKIDGGRIAAFEIMLGTPAIRNLIREDKIAQMYSVMQTSSKMGMRTMDQSLKDLVERNITTRESAHESGFQRELFE